MIFHSIIYVKLWAYSVSNNLPWCKDSNGSATKVWPERRNFYLIALIEINSYSFTIVTVTPNWVEWPQVHCDILGAWYDEKRGRLFFETNKICILPFEQLVHQLLGESSCVRGVNLCEYRLHFGYAIRHQLFQNLWNLKKNRTHFY